MIIFIDFTCYGIKKYYIKWLLLKCLKNLNISIIILLTHYNLLLDIFNYS